MAAINLSHYFGAFSGVSRLNFARRKKVVVKRGDGKYLKRGAIGKRGG